MSPEESYYPLRSAFVERLMYSPASAIGLPTEHESRIQQLEDAVRLAVLELRGRPGPAGVDAAVATLEELLKPRVVEDVPW